MAMPFIFNTLAYANKLVETGMSKEQAEAQALALHEVLSEGTVAPGELLILKTDLIARIDTVKQDLIARIDAFKHDLTARIDAVKHELIAHIDTVKHDLIAHIDTVKHDLIAHIDTVKHDLIARIDAVEREVGILKRKVNVLFWLVGLGLVLHAVEIGVLIYIIGRLP